MCKVNPAQVRKDLSFFGEFGVRGVGYNVHDLIIEIKKILASDREWKLGIAGLDDMGMALVQHKNFLNRGYKFVAAFDSDPKKIGQRLSMGLTIQPFTRIRPLAVELHIEIGVITTSPLQAQAVADMFFEAGVMAILNFSPIHLRKPDCCLVQNVDFSLTLDHLAYRLSKGI
jgi:redox-sensing transcriptional repressor